MAWWNLRRPAIQAPTPSSETRANFSVYVPPEMLQGGRIIDALSVTPTVSRKEALTVPAVRRARALICATLGGLPTRLHGPDRAVRQSTLLDQPEFGIPRSVSMTRLYEDLFFDGVAWWYRQVDGFDGKPLQVRRIDPSTVQEHPDGRVYVNGTYVPDGKLIRFDSPFGPLLEEAARAIRTCIKLEIAAARYAERPIPPGFWTTKDPNTQVDAESVREFQRDMTTAQAGTSTPYIDGAVTFQPIAITPEQMQLADSRQHAVLEIARTTGIAPEDLGISVTSRTYKNVEQDRIQFQDFTLGHFVSAVQDRLSMDDITSHGSYVKVAFEGFLRSDASTRMAVYKAGLDVGAYAEDEIRALEDKPDLTPAQRREARPQPAPQPTQEQPVVQNSADLDGLTSFTASGDVVSLTFGPSDLAEFKADPEKRTVSGMLLPFNVQTADDRSIRFAAGSITWQKAAVSRVKLDREHDLGQLLGSATKIDATDNGVTAAFKVARTPAGDEALALAADGALDGLSAVVRITDAIPDPVHEGGTLVTAATLVRATLTADPAFDDARLSAVALTKKGNTVMPDATEPLAPAAPAAAPDTAAFTSAVESFTAAVERLGTPQNDATPPASRTAFGFTVTEAPVYTFEAGHGPSIVRDTFRARNEGDRESMERLQKFAAQQGDVAKFATVNRTVGANVIPPGYRPDLYVPQLFQERPLFDMLSKGTLTDATPFTIPKFGSATGATADHVEGTNPSDGTLTLGTSVTVTPGGISGRFRITREIVDASNPAIDAIAFAAMKESYSQQTEGKVYTLINGASGVGGVITSGFVPSGAAVVTATGVGSTGAAGVALLDAVRQQIVEYPFRRFASPNRLALSSEAAVQFAKAKDGQTRPLLPRIGAQNASGTVSTMTQAFDIDGLAGVPAWSMTGNAAGDADTIMWNSQDVWGWESPLLTFRYEEVAGPANIDLALFGYFACAVLRAPGFSGVRLTVT